VWYENTQILTTQIFKIFVAESLRSDGSIESSNEYGALVVLFQNLYQSIDLMQSMVELFGQPGEVAAEAKIATFWQMLEYLYGVNAAALKNSSVNEVLDRIGLSSEGNTLFEVVEPLNELIDKLPKGSVKSVQRGLITLAGTVNTATATISTVDISKSIVLSTGYLTSNGGQDGMYTLTHLVLTDSTTVTAQRGATGNVVVTIPYQVVEFY
ncbi:MAG: hypothetical protein IIU81_03885, partial [Peptococcaceae bacterium]|nr:hypothetical protein [Peptococcaceae bacterium]